MIINIANTKNYIDLENDIITMAEKNDFKLIDIYRLALSNCNFYKKDEKYKYEPIFIFKKG